MHKRSLGLSLFGSLAIILAACSGGSTPSPSIAPAPTAAPSEAASPSAAASEAPSASAVAQANLKIGVVTDIGTLNDKGYNEYSFKGAVDGAAAIGSAAPQSTVPKDASEYAADIQAFVDQKYDVIVTVGFNLTGDTVKAAKTNPTIHFVGVDQSPVCVDPQGNPDPNFACKGDAKTLLPNYTSLYFAEDQAGYLAGIVAASASKTGSIGAIGGTTLCAPCVRYIQGYELGAKSINPNIKVVSAYVTNDFSDKAFNDPVTGTSFAQQFISQNHPDVLFQVAGKTGNGVIDAACSAGLYAVGVDVDQYLSYPNGDKCIITSAEKKLTFTVESTIKAIAAGTATAGDTLWNAANGGIGISDFHDKASLMPAGLQAKLDAALAAMKAGTLKTCPDKCGVLAPAASPAAS